LYKPLIFVFIDHSSERNIIFNVVNKNEGSDLASINNELELEGLCQGKRDETNENEDSDLASINNELELECLCQIKRDETDETNEKNCLERMFVRDSNRQYEQYCIEFIERIGLKLDIFEKFNKMNNNIEIYLCHHIKKSDFLIFYEFIISYYFPVHKMTIKKFYTILYFLEYFRVKDDNKLRNVIKSILYSLVESDEMQIFDIEKKLFYVSKQDYFSYALLKKISKEYFELVNNGEDLKFSFFIKENEYHVSYIYNGIFRKDRKHMLVINIKFNTFFNKKVVVNHKIHCLFLMFLNTLDIKYLHMNDLNRENSKSFCFILQNLKKKLDEIVFFGCNIYDDVICSLNANLNFENLKKMVFIKSKFDRIFIFTAHLSHIEEFIFYEEHSVKRYTLPKINKADLNIAEFIIKSLKNKQPQNSMKEFIKKNNYIPEENKDFYLKLLNEEKFRNKVKTTEKFECKNNNLEVECFYMYEGCFNNISITFYGLNGKQFFTTENTILEENIKSIKISYSAIKYSFLKDIFNIKGLERLEINCSNINIENENEIFINESIKYFSFSPEENIFYSVFSKLIDIMIGLQEIYFTKRNIIKLNRSVDQIFYIKELDLCDINEMIDLLKLSEKNKKFDFKATNKDILDSEYPIDSLNCLFQNYEMSGIKKLSIRKFSINYSNEKELGNLLNLKELNIVSINFLNISFSELFCAIQEYKIKRMWLTGINISEKDLIFIANLKKIEDIILWTCNIKENTYSEIEMLFFKEGYIELKYNPLRDNLPEETIEFITEKFKTKYIVIRELRL
ncbi:hypothetical protein CWI36_0814p0020, partial [Hamiltosporidium magnivora]